MNILILSCGTRNKILQYFKKTLSGKGRVVATDNSPFAPALYDADAYYLVPRIDEEGYLEQILDICKEEDIRGVLSLIDPELSLLAENEARFTEAGARVIGSSFDACELAMDKMAMYQWLVYHNYACAESYLEKEAFYREINRGAISYPVFIKPVRGSASLSVHKVYDQQTVELLFSQHNNLMIQEFLDGQEIGADVYIDIISGEVVSIFTKRKLLMRAGETDKAVSFKDNKLFDLIERFVREAGFRGQVDIDIFEVDGRYYISEVNPRFGGGYPHAFESGVDHMKLIVNNLQGIANEKQIGQYDDNVIMMKYSEVIVIRGTGK